MVLFDDVQSLDVTGPLEVFAHAVDHQGKRAYLIRTASLGGAQVRTTSGLAVTPDGDLRDLAGLGQPPDLLIVARPPPPSPRSSHCSRPGAASPTAPDCVAM